MIEATCTTCGNINRMADAEVPVGARFVSCTKCKSRVALPSSAEVADVPAPKRGGESKKPSGNPLALDDLLGQADLPAPRNPARPATPPAGVPTVKDLVDLPAPKARGGAVTAEASKLESGRLNTGLSDLPAPKAKPNKPLTPPAGVPAPLGLADLPTPRPKPSPLADLPKSAPAPKPLLGDLPAPKAGVADLPAPKAALPDLPAPAPKSALAGLPASAPKVPALGDLPAPRKPAIVDLPAPSLKAKTPPVGIPQVVPAAKPAPAKPAAAAATMLGPASTPRTPAPTVGEPLDLDLDFMSPSDQLAPKIEDVVQPKHAFDDLTLGTLDDLPQPKTADLPAPKGFFDDLPGPAKSKPAAPAAKTAPAGPATTPGGFFDDLPEPAHRELAPKVETGSDLAPKGFFDDLPGPANPNKPGDLAPKGFFDDLPGPASPNQPGDLAPKGFFDDLPQPTRAPARSNDEIELSQSAIELDSLPGRPEVSPPPRHAAMDATDDALELNDGIDLEPDAAPAPEPANKFDDLDLSEPTAAPIRFDTPKRARPPSGAPAPKLATLPSTHGAEIGLEVEGEQKPAARPAPVKKEKPKPAAEPKKEPMSPRKKRVLAIAAAGALALGAGGFVMYRRHVAAQERLDQISTHLQSARQAMTAADPQHWVRAANAAGKVLALEETHAEALGIQAEALLASALADGINATGNFTRAQKNLGRAVEAQATHPTIERAQALSPLASNRAEAALPRLEAQLRKSPNDPALALYLGWAQAMRNDFPGAIKSFDLAAKADAVKVPALYGRARAKLAQGDVEGARADFSAVLDVAKDHIASQVGLAASLPAAQAQQQEQDLIALLQRKDLPAADPRAITDAWVLVARSAQRGGRLDAARERYRKAIEAAKLLPPTTGGDVPAMTGLAEIELRDNNPKAAYDWITKATTAAKDDVHAQLVAAEIEIALKKLDSALARIQALTNRNPPPPRLEQARLKVVTGRLLEAQEQHAKAAEAFVEAAALAGDLDLTPALAAVGKLTTLANEATAAKDPAKAAELKARADKLLADVAKNAEKDLQLALTLGTSYLSTGDAVKAEPWLRKYVEARPADAEGQYQLSKALASLNKYEDAIERLRKAVELDPARTEIGLELARTYEAAGRDSDAVQLYTRLVAQKDVSLEVRARAGRFFARTGQIDKAAEQGEKILAVDEKHPAGLYLKAEGLLAKGETTAARTTMNAAIAGDPSDPQFLDGQGRAAEADSLKTGDTALQDVALRAYMAAAEAQPRMLNPWVGQGRLYVLRKEFRRAIDPLLKAVALAPNNGEIAFLMGRSYQELQQNKVAIQWLQRANQLEPRAEASWRLGVMFAAANQGPQAAAALKTATTLAFEEEKRTGKTPPWLVDALYELGSIYRDLNNDDGARQAWEQYVARNPPPSARLTAVKQALDTTLRR